MSLAARLRAARYAVTAIRAVTSTDGPCRYCHQPATIVVYYEPKGSGGYLQCCQDDVLAAVDEAANDSTDGTFYIEQVAA